MEVLEDDGEIDVGELALAELGEEGGLGLLLELGDVGGANLLLKTEDGGDDALGGHDALNDGAGLGRGADEDTKQERISEMVTGSVADKIASFSGVFVLEPDGSASGGLTMHDITLLGKQDSGFYSGAIRHTRELLEDGKKTVMYDEPSRWIRSPKRTPTRRL